MAKRTKSAISQFRTKPRVFESESEKLEYAYGVACNLYETFHSSEFTMLSRLEKEGGKRISQDVIRETIRYTRTKIAQEEDQLFKRVTKETGLPYITVCKIFFEVKGKALKEGLSKRPTE